MRFYTQHFILPLEEEDEVARKHFRQVAERFEASDDSDFTVVHRGEKTQLSPQLVDALRYVAGALSVGAVVELDTMGAVLTPNSAAGFIRVDREKLDRLVEEGVFEAIPCDYSPDAYLVKVSELLEYRQRVKEENEVAMVESVRKDEEVGLIEADLRMLEERQRQRKAYGKKHGLSPDDDFISDWEKTR